MTYFRIRMHESIDNRAVTLAMFKVETLPAK